MLSYTFEGCLLEEPTIREMVRRLRKHGVIAKTVKTRKKARSMTDKDPAGITWNMGDRYYTANMDIDGDIHEININLTPSV